MKHSAPPSEDAMEATLAQVRERVLGFAESVPAGARVRRRGRPPRAAIFSVAAFVLSGALTGGTVAAFATNGDGADVSRPTSEQDIMQVLDLTGRDAGDVVGQTVDFVGSGRNEIDLGAGPEGMADLAVVVRCSDRGYFTVGLGFVDSPVQFECVPSASGSSGFVFTGGAFDRTLIVDGLAGVRYSVSARWLTTPPGGWDVNANGQTYGPGVDGNVPVLLATVGKDAAGNNRNGYIYSADAFGPPQSTPEAVAEQKRLRLLEIPDGIDLPLYDSDGTTVLGTFHYRVRP